MTRAIILSLMLLITAALQAQIKESPTYWVVETNVNQKDFSIVRLYDRSNKLVHEVKMDGVYFDVTRAKHRKMLNQLLKGSYQKAEETAARIIRGSRTRRS
jgi:predicted secreted protein